MTPSDHADLAAAHLALTNQSDNGVPCPESGRPYTPERWPGTCRCGQFLQGEDTPLGLVIEAHETHRPLDIATYRLAVGLRRMRWPHGIVSDKPDRVDIDQARWLVHHCGFDVLAHGGTL
jgi:hypothetical protein